MRRKIDVLILVLVLVAGFFAIKNAQTIGDRWHGMRYDPPAEVSTLATNAGMSDRGKQLFYRFSPQLVGQKELDQRCTVEKLGCAEGRTIYILNYLSEGQQNQSAVTAAHEMLHIAYTRLSDQEKSDLEPLLQAEVTSAHGANIAKKLQDYPQEGYYNEAHSYVGSELPDISDKLEQYYKQYFSNRSKSVDAYAESPR